MNSPRGRPRTFCTDTALDKAMAVFWQNGFQGASLAELTHVMGLNKPSLYAAYGDKEALYLKVLQRYAEQYVKANLAVLETEPDAKEAIANYLRMVLHMQTNPQLPGGCLLMKGGSECPSTLPPAIQDALQTTKSLNRTMLHQRLSRAQAEGQLAADVCIDDLITLLLTLVSGFALMSQAGFTYDQLDRVVEQIMSVWPLAGSPLPKPGSPKKVTMPSPPKKRSN